MTDAKTQQAIDTMGEELSHLLGKSPRDYTLQDEQEVVKAFSKLPLKDLRRRQALTAEQLGMASIRPHSRTQLGIDNLMKMDNILMAAVSLREFGI